MYRIAVDVGGTFTDLVAIDAKGRQIIVKTDSTPEDQSVGVLRGLESLAERLSLPLGELLQQTQWVVHGMTVGTNALLERRGAKVGLLTTEGHRDVLEMREGLKPERYDMRLARQEPLVPRYLRYAVRERVGFNGQVLTPLQGESVQEAIEAMRAEDVESVAICFLHAYQNAEHEEQVEAMVRAAMPQVYVCRSSQVLPRIKEYERVSTTVVNAYVGPRIEHYLLRLQERLKQAGASCPLLIVLSHGGVAPVEEAVRIAAATVLSGPAGGVSGARTVARMLDLPGLLPLDMGGTSSDISLIVDGEASLARDRSVGEERIALPSLDIITIGAGGGSIARVEPGGILKVGPQSAGASPGPACYGRGGTQATVTDASVVLGFLDPHRFAGGAMSLDAAAAERALAEVGSELGLSPIQAAAGVHRVVNTQMAEGMRLATVRRGVDPRRFALLGCGGAAGLHATSLARLLEIEQVIVPGMASVLSAWGMLSSDLRIESGRSLLGELSDLDVEKVEQAYDALERDALGRMRGWFDGEIIQQRKAEMRYGEQVYEIEVPLDGISLSTPQGLDQLKRAFESAHEALYTYSIADQQPVLVNARATTVGLLDRDTKAAIEQASASSDVLGGSNSEPIAMRNAYLDGWCELPVYDFDDLVATQVIEGPALIESSTTTVLLQSGDNARVTAHGWLSISIS